MTNSFKAKSRISLRKVIVGYFVIFPENETSSKDFSYGNVELEDDFECEWDEIARHSKEVYKNCPNFSERFYCRLRLHVV